MPVDDDGANETEVVVGAARAAAGLCVCDVPALNDGETCPCTYVMPRNAAADIVDHSPSPAVTSSQSNSTVNIVDRSPSPAVTSSQSTSTADIVDHSQSPAVTSSQRSSRADVAETVTEVLHTSQSTVWADNTDVTLCEAMDESQSTLCGAKADVTVTQSCSTEAMNELTGTGPWSDEEEDALNALDAELFSQAAPGESSNTSTFPLLRAPADNRQAATNTEADDLRQQLAAATQQLCKFEKFRKHTTISNPATWMGFADNVVTELSLIHI